MAKFKKILPTKKMIVDMSGDPYFINIEGKLTVFHGNDLRKTWELFKFFVKEVFKSFKDGRFRYDVDVRE